MAKMPPIPLRVPVVDRRTLLLDRNWQQFFQALLVRTGGVGEAPTNLELQADDTQEVGAQTVAALAALEQELRGVQQLPVALPIGQESLEAFAPRGELVFPDFTLGEIT